MGLTFRLFAGVCFSYLFFFIIFFSFCDILPEVLSFEH